jgi:hypothetical protein
MSNLLLGVARGHDGGASRGVGYAQFSYGTGPRPLLPGRSCAVEVGCSCHVPFFCNGVTMETTDWQRA